MVSARVVFDTPIPTITGQIDLAWATTRRQILDGLVAGGLKMRLWAQANHRWTNRTGWAEVSLTHSVTSRPAGYEVILSHGAWYGIYLETGRLGPRYGVLKSAMAYGMPVMAADVRRYIG